MILSKFFASLLGNLITGTGVMRPGEGTITAGESTIRTDWSFYAVSSFNYF